MCKNNRISHLLKGRNWQQLIVICFESFENFMYLDQDSFGDSKYPKASCELNCTSKKTSLVTYWNLAVEQSPQGILWHLWQMLSTRVCRYWNGLHASHFVTISQLLLWELSIVNVFFVLYFVTIQEIKLPLNDFCSTYLIAFTNFSF